VVVKKNKNIWKIFKFWRNTIVSTINEEKEIIQNLKLHYYYHFKMWLTLDYWTFTNANSFSNHLPETTFCTPGVQTSSADKHVDRKSRVSKAGWYESLDFVFPLFIFVFFALRASRSISGARSLPSFGLHSRRSAFGTLIAQLLFKLAHQDPMRSNLARSPPTSFPLWLD